MIWGHKQDPVDSRDWPFTLLALHKRGAALAPVDLRPYVPTIRDQGRSGSCVAQAFARAIDVRARVMGRPLNDYPSVQAMYAVARQLERQAPGPLADVGSYPRLCAKGISEIGIVAEARMPFDVAKIGDGVPWDVVRAGASGRIVESQSLGYYRIRTAAEVRLALSSGYPCPFALQVDDAFMSYSGGIYRRWGAIQGGHMMTIVGYPDMESFYVVNSWGTGWGERGFMRLPAALLDDASIVSDIYALDFPPEAIR